MNRPQSFLSIFIATIPAHLSFGKTGNKKRANCFATLLQSESIGAIPHLFERLFLISWENNRDCHITMPLSLKTIEVQIKGDRWNKRFRMVQVYCWKAMLRVLPAPFKPVNHPDLLQDRFEEGGKTRNVAIQLVLQECCKTSCMFFGAHISLPLLCQMKANSTGVECSRTLSKLIKREIRYFHVVVTRWRQRNVQKRLMHH